MYKRDEKGRLIDIGFGSTEVTMTVCGFDKENNYFNKKETYSIPNPDPNVVHLPNLGLFY